MGIDKANWRVPRFDDVDVRENPVNSDANLKRIRLFASMRPFPWRLPPLAK